MGGRGRGAQEGRGVVAVGERWRRGGEVEGGRRWVEGDRWSVCCSGGRERVAQEGIGVGAVEERERERGRGGVIGERKWWGEVGGVRWSVCCSGGRGRVAQEGRGVGAVKERWGRRGGVGGGRR